VNPLQRILLIGALACAAAMSLLTGCGKSEEPTASAAPVSAAPAAAPPAEKPAEIAPPGIAETTAIAEEGFIFGLPIVMNYAVMNEFVLDKNSSQYKAPFNTISNEARVCTYEDTAIVTPNSDTPYSMLWLDLRAEPMVISVPAVEKERYYSVQLIDGNTYNYGYIGSRATGTAAGSYLVVGPGWKGDAPAGVCGYVPQESIELTRYPPDAALIQYPRVIDQTIFWPIIWEKQGKLTAGRWFVAVRPFCLIYDDRQRVCCL
jgi:hypothetical protein